MKDYYDMTPEEQLAEDYEIARQMEAARKHHTWMQDLPPRPKKEKQTITVAEYEQFMIGFNERMENFDKFLDTIDDRLRKEGKL
jgi:hypothetical protein